MVFKGQDRNSYKAAVAPSSTTGSQPPGYYSTVLGSTTTDQRPWDQHQLFEILFRPDDQADFNPASNNGEEMSKYNVMYVKPVEQRSKEHCRTCSWAVVLLLALDLLTIVAFVLSDHRLQMFFRGR